jgi:hypothetical protein
MIKTGVTKPRVHCACGEFETTDHACPITHRRLKDEIERLRGELQDMTDTYHANGWPSPNGETLAGENERLRAVESLSREMIQEMRLTPDGLIVREKKDRSDAHYRLCALLWPKAQRVTPEPSETPT